MSWGRALAGVFIGVIVFISALVAVDGRPSSSGCTPVQARPAWTVAREWNEATLDAIRRDLPAPTVHARNLFHTSAAMWDAWAAYEPRARGVFVDEDQEADDVAAARSEAISYAAYRILEHRYADSVGASDTIPQLDQLLEDRCLERSRTTTVGDGPAALGNRIAAEIIAAGMDDGANERDGYEPRGYEPVNPPLEVAASRLPDLVDPNRWQPLQMESMVSQNGIPLEQGVQEFIGPHWGGVDGFATPPPGADALPMDPGPPPWLGDPDSDAAFKDAVVDLIHYSARLDPERTELIDTSPGASGANPLGTNDGDGHPVNPETGEPYAPNLVDEADHLRALAVYWADGPSSETPPGHWNAFANQASDQLAPALRIGGDGPRVDRLEWDVKLYLALNGANHDAAIAAWGAKGHYDYARPISMIRYMGGLGQSSDPDAEAYHPDGLPLADDLIEVVTEESTASGARHDHLADHEGEIAVRSWIPPTDPERGTGRVDWIRAVDWVTYQPDTFVTPSFAGYVSGHSTFSHASAAVLEGFTGSRYVPGGIGTHRVPARSFEAEHAPAESVELQWATYTDAADQAGISRLYGGIHVEADDLAGRQLGAECGRAAWARAQRQFGRTAGGQI
ncbi:MAG: vanadium-dependent haloperoxidase [Nitriliruptoraceae bacterium]